jgi:hypothetical protein
MKRTVIMIWMICLLTNCASALAQSGMSNQRDIYGNLARDSGTYSPRGVNQGPANNGPIRGTPAQPSTSNVGKPKSANK